MVTSEARPASAFENFTNIYTAPAAAFAALKERPTALLPALALVLASCAVTLLYYRGVDVGWLLDRSIDQTNLTPEARQALAAAATGRARYVTMVTSTTAAALVVLVVFLVNAGYLSLVSLLTNDGVRFRQWFSLVCWASLPGLLSQIASLVNLAVSDVSHLPQEHINPLSYASLVDLELAPGVGSGTRILASMDPLVLWTLALMAVGYGLWTGKGIIASALIAWAPFLLFVALVVAL